MIYINWLLKLRFLSLKNSLWKDKKTANGTLFFTFAVIIGQIILTRIFYRSFFSQAADTGQAETGMTSIFFLVAVLWIYLASFFQCISSFMRNFYKSPDLSYLITIPIPINYIFLFKFFEYVITSAKSILFLFFPLLTALGIWTDAPLVYYLLIIPIYLLISIIPCSLGATVAMIGLKHVPAKLFNLLTPALTFLTNIIFAVLFTRSQTAFISHLSRIITFFDRAWLTDLFPVTASLKLFNAAITGGWPIVALLFLLIISTLIIFIAYLVSKFLFLNGWANNQIVVKQVSSKKNSASDTDQNLSKKVCQPTTHYAFIEWVKHEWKMAMRNHEMFMGSLFMFLFFLFAVFIFIYGRLFADYPLAGASLLITIASVFNIMAVSVLFLPADITKDKTLWKTRYWLLKIMPLEGKDIFLVQCFMYYFPGYLISLLGLILYTVLMGLSFYCILLTCLYLTAVLFGSAALYTTVELLTLTGIFARYPILGNLISIMLPLFYSLLSAGSMTLFLSKQFVSHLEIISDISDFLTLPLVCLLSGFVVLSTLLLSKRVYSSTWSKMEL